MNDYYEPIMNCNSWEEIDQKFKKIYNKKATVFKLVAPKNLDNSHNKPIF